MLDFIKGLGISAGTVAVISYLFLNLDKLERLFNILVAIASKILPIY